MEKEAAVDIREEKLPLKNKIGYMCSGMGNFFSMILQTFVLYYATESLGVTMAAVSAMIVIVKVLDGFTDVICGVIIDKTKSKKGKARPWLLRMAIPYPLCMALIFFVPESWGATAQILALGALYALTVSIFGTLVGVARVAILPRMTFNPKEQGVMATLNDGASTIMASLIMTITVPLATRFSYAAVFVVYSLFACVMCIAAYALTKERDDIIESEMKPQNQLTIKQLLKALFTNKYALFLLIYMLLLNFSVGFLNSSGLYYTTYVCGDVNLFSTAMGFNTISTIIGVVIGVPLVSKIGSKKMFTMCTSVPVITYAILWALQGNNPTAIVVCITINGFFLACAPAQMIAISAGVVDYGEWKSGKRTEGVTSAVVNVGIKIGSALATAVIGFIMTYGGFVSGAEVQTASALKSISFSFAGMPTIFYAFLTIFFLLTYRLEKQRAQIQQDLIDRRGELED